MSEFEKDLREAIDKLADADSKLNLTRGDDLVRHVSIEIAMDLIYRVIKSQATERKDE